MDAIILTSQEVNEKLQQELAEVGSRCYSEDLPQTELPVDGMKQMLKEHLRSDAVIAIVFDNTTSEKKPIAYAIGYPDQERIYNIPIVMGLFEYKDQFLAGQGVHCLAKWAADNGFTHIRMSPSLK